MDRRIAAWRQIGMVPQAQWSGAVEARFLAGPASHETDGQELVELGQRAQQGNPGIEVRAGTELDIFPSRLHPVRYRHKARNPEIAGDVEHPKPASGFGKLALQIANVGIVELAEVHLRPLQSIVPPDRVCIPFHQLEESLDDCFLERVAGRAAVGIRVEWRGAPVEKIQKAGRKIFEAFVAQGPDRRPFDLGRSIEWGRASVGIVVRLGRRRLRPAVCASLNSRTSFGRMASPGGKSVNRRFTLISSP